MGKIGQVAWNKGLKLVPLSEGHKKKISEGVKKSGNNSGMFKKGFVPWNKNKKGTYSLKHLGQFKKGIVPWNKGKHPEYVQGKNHPMYGKHHSEESKLRMSLVNKGKRRSLKTEFKKGLIPPFKGQTKETNPILARISYENSKIKGEQTSNWQGGISLNPYPLGWTKTFREQIRKRDKYRCQICRVPEVECNRNLHVHHIDYNKINLNKDNLISLCDSCHLKTNYMRENWKNYFKGVKNNGITFWNGFASSFRRSRSSS